MSSPANSQSAVTSDVPTSGVRNRAEHSETIHRPDPDADGPLPACGERGRDAEFKTAYIPSLLPFNRWSLCQNDACFGDDKGDDGDLDRGEGLEADGGRVKFKWIVQRLSRRSPRPQGARASDAESEVRRGRPGRKPTRWETTVTFHPPVLPDSAVRAHVSRSPGRSSPAPIRSSLVAVKDELTSFNLLA